MGLFGGLDQDRYDRQYSDGYLFRRLWDYLKPQRQRVWGIAITNLLVSLMLASLPILISAGVDALENNASDQTLMLLVGALGLTALLQYAGNWVERRLTGRMIGNLIAQLRKDAFRASVERDMAFYDENKTGKILSRITSDTEDLGQVMLFSAQLVSQMVQIVLLLAVLLSRNVTLTVMVFVFLLPVILATMGFRVLARKVTRQGSRAMAEVNGTIQETVTGISVAKNFRQEAMIYNAFENVNNQSYRANLQRGMVLASIFPVLNALVGLTIGGIVYMGARMVVAGTLSVSVWYLYLQAVERFFFPIINLASYWSQFQQGLSALERIFALIDTENTVQQIDDQPVTDLGGRIEFKDVTFQYKDGQPVLKDFSLTIQPGENVAFVGHTGAGKSTIAKQIMRLYEFQKGSICIDGRDIRSFNLQQYRQRIGFVPQTPFLFSGTIADNIRYSKPGASDAEVREIAYSIGNGEWLETLPLGLESPVGERGARLSIGQRQLVSLLRVLMQKPDIFILDEATASVDSFTEAQIQEALDMILENSTSILIAHRLSTVKSADRIIVLREGGIIEQGNHQQLLAQGGHYAELYNTYFRHQSLQYIEDARKLADEDAASEQVKLHGMD